MTVVRLFMLAGRCEQLGRRKRQVSGAQMRGRRNGDVQQIRVLRLRRGRPELRFSSEQASHRYES